MALTIKDIEDALNATGGFVSQAGKKLGCCSSNLYARISRSDRLKKVKRDIEESYLDLSESKLMKQIQDGNLGAICFHLKCKGKHRGWIEKQEVAIADDREKVTKVEIITREDKS